MPLVLGGGAKREPRGACFISASLKHSPNLTVGIIPRKAWGLQKSGGRDWPRPPIIWLRVRVLKTSREHNSLATVLHFDGGDAAHRIDAGRQVIPVGVADLESTSAPDDGERARRLSI